MFLNREKPSQVRPAGAHMNDNPLLHKIRNRSISWKLNLVILLVSGSTLLLSAAAFVYQYSNEAQDSKLRELQSLASAIGINCAASLLFDDLRVAGETLGALSAVPHLVSACIYNEEGKLFAAYCNSRTGSADCPDQVPEQDTSASTGAFLVLFHHIVVNSTQVGTIFIKYDLQGIRSRLYRYITAAVIILGVAFGLIVVLSNMLQRIFSRPILNLTRVVRDISQKKNYSLRAEKHSEDEIGVLIDGFNEMVSEIQARDEFLEQQVAARTQQLQQTNVNLRREMQERQHSEEKLKRSEERFMLAAHGSQVGIWDWNFKTGRVYYSPEWKGVLGYQEHEVSDCVEGWRVLLHPDDRERAEEAISLSISGSRPNYELEHRLRHKDGTYRWVLARGLIFRDEAGQPYRMAGSHIDITALKEAEEKVKASLAEKEVLLKELHHRVKNNMATITGLLKLQARKAEDAYLHEAFRECENRIQSMALVHNIFYESANFSHIDFKPYVNNLAHMLVASYAPHAVTTDLRIEEVFLSIDRAIPCGLIINELITNALKYAFPGGRPGTISLAFQRKNGAYILRLSDNGVGLPEAVDFEHAGTLGMTLVRMLTEQLRGSIDVDRTAGTTFVISF